MNSVSTFRFIYQGIPTSNVDYTDPSLDWDSAIPWLRSQTKLQLWLKGVLSADDVALAIKYGLDGVVVSNHGGRQLDGVPATLDALRECASAAGSKIPVAMDGGIRRGSDIFKAIALGASHVFVGRIPIWGLAVSYLGTYSKDVADDFTIVQRAGRYRTRLEDFAARV